MALLERHDTGFASHHVTPTGTPSDSNRLVHTDGVRALVVPPGGRIVSGAGDGTLRVADSPTGRRLAMFVADAPITALLAARDKLNVAGDAGGAIHFLRFDE